MNSLSGRKRFCSFLLLIAVGCGVSLFCGCGSEREELVRKKLEVISADDLAAIIDSIEVDNLLDKPYYKVVSFKSYSEGKYTYKAVVEFYFLKKVSVKVVRKYRYHLSVRMWDRYSNEYVFIHDTTGNATDQ